MSLTRAAIEKNRVTAVALAVVFAAGILAFLSLPRAEDPGFIVRAAQVITYFPGASPERVELLVTDKLEKAIQEMPEVDFIESESKTGVSILIVSVLESYTNMRPIWDKLRRKVEDAMPELPTGIRGPFVNDEFGDVFGTIVTVTGEGYSYAELEDVAEDVRDELLLIPEVAKVEIYGAQEERIFVEYNNARLAELGVSPYQLQQLLESQNIIFPGGDVRTAREQIVLEPSGNIESVEALRATVIRLPGRDDLMYLGDLAEVSRGYIDPPRTKLHARGTPGLALAVSLREGGNIIELGEKVQALVFDLESRFPIGVAFDFVALQSYHVERKIDDFVSNLLQAVGIVLLVMLVSLGLRTGLVVASLVPMAMIASLLVMSFLGIGLDQMSLAALIIALGMLVDNAIVMSESILVQMKEGKEALAAALDSARELQIPLLTSSLTTAAAFLPIYLAESSTGEYTAPLFEVVTITLLSSWLLSLTMTPLFCVLFLRVKPTGEESFDSRAYRTFRKTILWALRHRALALGGAMAAFVLSLVLLGRVPNIFFPPNDKAIFTAELRLPVGSPLGLTESVVTELESYMENELSVDAGREGGITNWASFIGEGAPRFFLSYTPTPPTPEFAILLVNAASRERLASEIIPLMERFCFESFPDLRASIALLPLGPSSEAPVEARLLGGEEDKVFELVDRVRKQLEGMQGVRNVRDDWGLRTKKIVVNIDQPRAQRAGLSSQDVALSLQTVLSGYETTEYREGDKVIPVTLRSVAAERTDIGKLESHDIFSQATGRSVPLKQVADLEVVWQPAVIYRRDRLKTVTVQADVTPGTSPVEVSLELDRFLREESANWPLGYRYELGGDYENSVKANESIVAKLPIAMFIIVFVLVAQFNSIRKPLIILATIPLSLIGVAVGLNLLRSYMGFMTFLGIISLAGVVINNAIVLIDRIQIEIAGGRDPAAAIVEAAQRRLRPILLTTGTTIGGLVPLYLGGGPMWEPMAIAIMFGLAFATVLTLGVVPILYGVFYRVSNRSYTAANHAG
ncbi:MAG TPA: efflux RND transporter permease subunit [Vicinamibacteria bacterium]|nr:efflux RND transporter permease subunit [Vicinamibacteria bacterium]